MKRVLILCTGNSCRSQMAEAIWNRSGGDQWQAESAGSRPAGYVHPLAVQVMHEIGTDISQYRSKSLDEYRDASLDLVVTVCDSARESCPALPGAVEMLHWPFDDPADASGNEAEKLDAFRRVRDEIAEKVAAFLGGEQRD